MRAMWIMMAALTSLTATTPRVGPRTYGTLNEATLALHRLGNVPMFNVNMGAKGDERMSFAGGAWLNEPAHWGLKHERLHAMTDSRADFWRETHYGFTRDSGHFFGREIAGPFTA